jgi:tRNA(Ile)-lysidine synthase TilS/MesJ
MNTMSLAKVISRFITTKLIKKQLTLVTTISGGQDSMLLFFILLHIYGEQSEKNEILHFHHFWSRSNFCACWHIFKLQYYFSVPTTIILAESSTSSETRAKLWRENSLQRFLHFSQGNMVLTGQTSSDNVETAVFQLCRGVGIQTIQQKGRSHSKTRRLLPSYFTPEIQLITRNSRRVFYGTSHTFIKKKIKKKSFSAYFHKLCFQSQPSITNARDLFRDKSTKKTKRIGKTYQYVFFEKTSLEYEVQQPLQLFYRSDITKLVKDCSIPLVPDSTNQNIKIRRNRIRLQLLPTLRYFFNPQFDSAFTRFLTTSTTYTDFVNESIIKNIRLLYTTVNKQQLIQTLTPFERKIFFQTLYRIYARRQLTAAQMDYLEKMSIQ